MSFSRGVKDLGGKTDIPGSSKVLLIAPDERIVGGISNFYRLLFRKYRHPSIKIFWFNVGSRSENISRRSKQILLYIPKWVGDLKRFRKILRKDREVQVVHVNPSLRPLPLIRDGIFARLAQKRGKKVVVSFRGWSRKVEERLDKKGSFWRLFLFFYGKIHRSLVLAEPFKEALVRWGIPRDSVSISRTMFDGRMVPPIQKDIQEEKSLPPRFLFLGRIQKSKGVFEILDAVVRLKSQGYDFKLTLSGWDPQQKTENQLKQKASLLGIQDICRFPGPVEGEEKFRLYSQADVYLFPSFHDEGCPTTVLEAMASGNFIVSSDAGALGEIIKEGENGWIVRQKDVSDLTQKMKKAVENIQWVRSQGKKNRDYAFKHFESTIITSHLTKIYESLLWVGPG